MYAMSGIASAACVHHSTSWTRPQSRSSGRIAARATVPPNAHAVPALEPASSQRAASTT